RSVVGAVATVDPDLDAGKRSPHPLVALCEQIGARGTVSGDAVVPDRVPRGRRRTGATLLPRAAADKAQPRPRARRGWQIEHEEGRTLERPFRDSREGLVRA